MGYKGKAGNLALHFIKYLYLICAFNISLEAHAAPDETTRFLLNQPVSEFSFGMWKLNRALASISGDNNDININLVAEYSWNDDRIYILSNFISMPATKDNCSKIIARIRKSPGVDPQRGILNPNQKSFSKLSRLFMPIGYKHKSAPKDYLKSLDNKFRISVSLYGKINIGDKITSTISCEGKLISNRVLYNR